MCLKLIYIIHRSLYGIVIPYSVILQKQKLKISNREVSIYMVCGMFLVFFFILRGYVGIVWIDLWNNI